MASPGGSNYSTVDAAAPTPEQTNKNKKRVRRQQQTLLSSSSSGGGSDNSSSGISSESMVPPTTETSPEMQALIEQRRKRRKDSNRESARRSRMRKQMHIDGMAAQVAGLRAENYKMLVVLESTTAGYLTVEAENSVLRTQALELQSRLRSLQDLVLRMQQMNMNTNMNMNNMNMNMVNDGSVDMGGDMMMNWPNWGMAQPIMNMPLMPSLDVYQDCI